MAKGYTQEQLTAKGTDITNGASGEFDFTLREYISTQPWGKYTSNIKKVIIEEEIKPKSTSYYFLSLKNVNQIEGLENLNTSNVTNMGSMFSGCSGLSSLDLSKFDTSNVKYMSVMFNGCSNLQIIYVSNKWSTVTVIDTSSSMFQDCIALKGAISYDSTKVEPAYANYTTGYLTYKAAN